MTYLTGYKTANLNKQIKNLNGSVNTNIEKISNNPNEKNAIIKYAEVENPVHSPISVTLISVEISIRSASLILIIKSVYNSLENVYKNKPSEEELETIKKHMLKNYGFIVENNANLNDFIASNFLNCNYARRNR